MSSSRDLPIGGCLFRNLQDLLVDRFSCANICNILRNCNSVAHGLATRRGLGWDSGRSKVWTDPIPEFAITLCARDFAEPVLVNERSISYELL